MRKIYYTEDIAVLSKDRVSETLEDYSDNQLECTGTATQTARGSNKQIRLYEITNNEPKQIDWILLNLEDDSRLEVYDYLHNKYENFEIIKL